MGERAPQSPQAVGLPDDEGMQDNRENQRPFARLQQHFVELVDHHGLKGHRALLPEDHRG